MDSVGEVFGARMGDGDRRVLFEEHQCDWLADQRAAAENQGALTLGVASDLFEHPHATARRAGAKALAADD